MDVDRFIDAVQKMDPDSNPMSRGMSRLLRRQAREGLLKFGEYPIGASAFDKKSNLIENLLGKDGSRIRYDSDIQSIVDMAVPTKNRITVCSWDMQRDGSWTVELPSTAIFSKIQVVDWALRSDIYNVSGDACSGMISINGVEQVVQIAAGGYTVDQLFAAVKSALETAYIGPTFTISTSPIRYLTTLAKSGAAQPVQIKAVQGSLFWLMGFRTETVSNSFGSVVSSNPIDLSSLNAYALTCSNLTSNKMNWADGAGMVLGTMISTHAAGTICRSHALNVLDLGTEQRTSYLTFGVTDLLNKTQLELGSSLFVFVLDLW